MKFPNTKTRYGSFVLCLALCTLLIILPACGGDSNSSDSDNKWDEMVWDQDKWG